MPVGDCQRAFGVAATNDGVPVAPMKLASLTDAGHLALQPSQANRATLQRIFVALRGDETDLSAGPHRLLPLDWVVPDAHLIIEIDEEQHFTTDRLRTLNAYPAELEFCFNIREYKMLCEVLSARSDRYRADKEARGFRRSGGRRAQRAYLDAVKDLGSLDLGWRVFRVPAAHQDGARAYREVRQTLRAQL